MEDIWVLYFHSYQLEFYHLSPVTKYWNMLCVSVMSSEEQKKTDAHLPVASVRYEDGTGPVN